MYLNGSENTLHFDSILNIANISQKFVLSPILLLKSRNLSQSYIACVVTTVFSNLETEKQKGNKNVS
jgi:hypothetical protein